jgi:beta-lactamase regulating signal transducer with metallopeptidase domain
VTDLFLKVLEMSIMGSVVVLATILFRFLLRKRSKRFIMILWAVVAVRLLLPVNIQSDISIFNYIPLRTDAITTQIQEAKIFEETGADAAVADSIAERTHIDLDVHGSADDHHESTVTAVHNEHVRTVPEVKTILAAVWFIGFAAVASYTVIRFILLKIKLKDAVKICAQSDMQMKSSGDDSRELLKNAVLAIALEVSDAKR